MKTLFCLLVIAFAPFSAQAGEKTYGEIRGNNCYFIEPTSIIPSATAAFCPENGLERKVYEHLKANGLRNDIANNKANLEMDKGCRATVFPSQLTVTAFTLTGSMNQNRYYQFRIDTRIECGDYFNDMPIYVSYVDGNDLGSGFYALQKLF